MAETEGNESFHYKGSVDKLNTVKQSLESFNLMQDSIYRHGVKFEIYDKLMAGGVGNDAALKPDLLARVPSKDDAYWEDVELCVDVKGKKYSDMVLQGATYARSISYAQRGREFVLVIFHDQTKFEVSFGLFWPAVLYLSHKQNLRSRKGQEAFIRDMAQIWTCNNRWSAGFDDAGRRIRIDIVDAGDIWTESLAEQNTYVLREIRDRNGYISGIQNQEEYSMSGAQSEQLQEGTSDSGAKVAAPPQAENSQLTRSSDRIAEKKRLAEEEAISISKRTVENSPSVLPIIMKQVKERKKWILKDSWPLVSRANREADVFNVEDQEQDQDDGGNESEKEKGKKIAFGLYNLLGCFQVKNKDGQVSNTASRYPEDMKPLTTIFKEDQEGLKQSDSSTMESDKPEDRVHTRLLIGTEGVSLVAAKGPRELLRAILHAIIGYTEIFKRGWLHRDVSIGNVMLMETPEKRRVIKEFPKLLTREIIAKHFSECVGFLSDGDLAVSWNKPEKEPARQRSGTPPFMSVYLLQTLGGRAMHSPIDDLESFIWVFFWAILSALQLHGAKLTKAERKYWSCLRSRDLSTLISKEGFLNILRLQKIEMLNRQKLEEMEPARKKQKMDPEETQEPGPPSCGFEPFVKPLFDWLELAFSGKAYEKRFELRSAPTEEYKKIVLLWIAEYLSKGINHLDELPETWQYISQ